MEPPDQSGGNIKGTEYKIVGRTLLQWSRLTSQAETFCVPNGGHRTKGASMEPPDQSGGNRDITAMDTKKGIASMEPPDQSGGNRS